MDRLVLSDAAWERMAPLIIGRPDQKGSTGRNNRMFVDARPKPCAKLVLGEQQEDQRRKHEEGPAN
jgi:hypothetical protein